MIAFLWGNDISHRSYQSGSLVNTESSPEKPIDYNVILAESITLLPHDRYYLFCRKFPQLIPLSLKLHFYNCSIEVVSFLFCLLITQSAVLQIFKLVMIMSLIHLWTLSSLCSGVVRRAGLGNCHLVLEVKEHNVTFIFTCCTRRFYSEILTGLTCKCKVEMCFRLSETVGLGIVMVLPQQPCLYKYSVYFLIPFMFFFPFAYLNTYHCLLCMLRLKSCFPNWPWRGKIKWGGRWCKSTCRMIEILTLSHCVLSDSLPHYHFYGFYL